MVNGALTFGSVCDGIGCGHLAFESAGFACSWSAEIEPFPCAVLAQMFPGVPNIGDMRKAAGMIGAGEIAAPDVFIGGTPCQAFSVAGKREGLKDERGNLSLEFCRIADAIDDVRRGDGKPPCVVLWENVPGVLSDKGNAFGCFLGELSGSGCVLQPPGEGWANAGCVFGPVRTVAWRTLDSQYFGVAQRRARVFVVASAGDWARPEEVLFEREGVRRDSAPRREAGEGVAPTLDVRAGRSGETSFHTSGGLAVTYDVAPCLGASGRGVERAGETRGQDPVIAVMAHGQGCAEVSTDGGAPYLTCNHEAPIVAAVGGDVAHALRGEGFDAGEDGTGRGTPVIGFSCKDNGRDVCDGISPTLRAMGHGATHANAGGQVAVAVSFQQNQLGEVRTGDVCGTLNTNFNASGRNTPMAAVGMQVRRLTPRECERLQGLPDDWTRIAWRGKPAETCPDGPRYKGIGNGQTVQVMQWIASRIHNAISTPALRRGSPSPQRLGYPVF